MLSVVVPIIYKLKKIIAAVSQMIEYNFEQKKLLLLFQLGQIIPHVAVPITCTLKVLQS